MKKFKQDDVSQKKISDYFNVAQQSKTNEVKSNDTPSASIKKSKRASKNYDKLSLSKKSTPLIFKGDKRLLSPKQSPDIIPSSPEASIRNPFKKKCLSQAFSKEKNSTNDKDISKTTIKNSQDFEIIDLCDKNSEPDEKISIFNKIFGENSDELNSQHQNNLAPKIENNDHEDDSTNKIIIELNESKNIKYSPKKYKFEKNNLLTEDLFTEVCRSPKKQNRNLLTEDLFTANYFDENKKQPIEDDKKLMTEDLFNTSDFVDLKITSEKIDNNIITDKSDLNETVKLTEDFQIKKPCTPKIKAEIFDKTKSNILNDSKCIIKNELKTLEKTKIRIDLDETYFEPYENRDICSKDNKLLNNIDLDILKIPESTDLDETYFEAGEILLKNLKTKAINLDFETKDKRNTFISKNTNLSPKKINKENFIHDVLSDEIIPIKDVPINIFDKPKSTLEIEEIDKFKLTNNLNENKKQKSPKNKDHSDVTFKLKISPKKLLEKENDFELKNDEFKKSDIKKKLILGEKDTNQIDQGSRAGDNNSTCSIGMTQLISILDDLECMDKSTKPKTDLQIFMNTELNNDKEMNSLENKQMKEVEQMPVDEIDESGSILDEIKNINVCQIGDGDAIDLNKNQSVTNVLENDKINEKDLSVIFGEWGSDDEMDCDQLINTQLLNNITKKVETNILFEDEHYYTFNYFKIIEIRHHDKYDIEIKIKSPKYYTQMNQNNNSKLANSNNELTVSCLLTESWTTSIEYKINDEVNINARKIKKTNDVITYDYIITNKYGYIIWNPSEMINSTQLMMQLTCERKSALSFKYKSYSNYNESLVIGCLIHELLQTVLKDKLYKDSEIVKLSENLLNRNDTLKMLFSADIKYEQISKIMKMFVEKVKLFLIKYVDGYPVQDENLCKNKKWNGKITEIVDIEENISCPELGLKGRIDATVKTSMNDFLKPFEIKTGKTTVSSEYRGQVGVYVLMMEKLGYKTDSGLLYNLRNDILEEIILNEYETRDLLILRNKLTYQISKIRCFSIEQDIEDLPNPVNDVYSCKYCPNIFECSVNLKQDKKIQLESNHPVKIQSERYTSHLTDSHLNYFRLFERALSAENYYAFLEMNKEFVWTQPLEVREKNGTALGNLYISDITMIGSIYLTTFKHKQNLDFRKFGFNVGDFKQVSTNTQMSISLGSIVKFDKHKISLNLERNLQDRYKNETFILDSYQINYNSRALSSLILILNNDSQAERLRDIVIDNKIPEFDQRLSKNILNIGMKILINLNQTQTKAILKALSAKDYLLINGMPGTGKTETIVGLVKILFLTNQSILISSHTNSAVDNMLIKLIESEEERRNLEKSIEDKILRIGPEYSINKKLHHLAENELLKKCKNLSDVEQMYKNIQIVAVTCHNSISHPLFQKRMFDVCIIDESTQVIQPLTFGPILNSKKFILVGDPDQLTPVVKTSPARQLGLNISLFERLCSDISMEKLTIQYRMNKVIMDLINRITYENQLTCGNDQIANATLTIPNQDVFEIYFKYEKWLLKTCSNQIEDAVCFLNTNPSTNNDLIRNLCEKYKYILKRCFGDKKLETFDENLLSCINICEAIVTKRIVNALIKGGVDLNSIGIISPYRFQVKLLNFILNLDNLEINTVDQYQGRDKDVIIYSCSKTFVKNIEDENNEYQNILLDQRRLTVAITRAKHKLIIIGDKNILNNFLPFKKLFENLTEEQILNLNDNIDGFKWNNLFNQFNYY